MKTEYVRGLTWMALLLGGAALAVLLLLGITGGFIVGTLAFLVITPAMTVLAIAHTLEKRRLTKAQRVTPETVVTEADAEAVAAPVFARVIAARGVCPMGYRHRVGEVWTMNGKAEGAHTLCPAAEAKLLEAGKNLRGEGERTEKVICETKDHQVVIELANRKVELASG